MWNVSGLLTCKLVYLLENSSIISKKILNKRTIEKLSNEILSTDRQENENRIEQFAEENDIRRE